MLSRFAKRQGLHFTFAQCDDRMFKIAERRLPYGVQFGGGSDWFCLGRSFVDYLLKSDDEHVQQLTTLFNYTLLPSEVGHITYKTNIYFHFTSLYLNVWMKLNLYLSRSML